MKNDSQTKEVDVIDPRWEKFFQFYLETGKVVEAGIKAGFSEHYAKQLRARYPDKVNRRVQEAFSTEYITGKHKELYEKKNIERMTFEIEMSDEEIKELVETIPGCKLLYIRRKLWGKDEQYGERYAYVSVPDGTALNKALEHSFKLRGDYAPINTVNVNVDGNKLFNEDQKDKTKGALRRYFNRRVG